LRPAFLEQRSENSIARAHAVVDVSCWAIELERSPIRKVHCDSLRLLLLLAGLAAPRSKFGYCRSSAIEAHNVLLGILGPEHP
jgi:hypothetical protein